MNVTSPRPTGRVVSRASGQTNHGAGQKGRPEVGPQARGHGQDEEPAGRGPGKAVVVVLKIAFGLDDEIGGPQEHVAADQGPGPPGPRRG